jgi:hypothetical protein
LAKPDFSKDFTIYTNSIEEVIYVILLQKYDENAKQPIDFMSQNLSDHFDNLRQVFSCCRKYGMSLNPTKSIFGVTS